MAVVLAAAQHSNRLPLVWLTELDGFKHPFTVFVVLVIVYYIFSSFFTIVLQLLHRLHGSDGAIRLVA